MPNSVWTTKVETTFNFGGQPAMVSPLEEIGKSKPSEATPLFCQSSHFLDGQQSRGQNVRVLVLGGSPEENKGLEGTWTRAHETLGQFPAPQWGQSIAIGPYEDLDVC